MNSKDIIKKLDIMYPNAKCELNYNKDYELLIATVLSAQCTDKRVNEVAKELFLKYDIYSLAKAKKEDIEKIIYPLGSFNKKSKYLIDIANSLVNNYDGHIPNDREYLESLPGVGRKTCNVVLSNLFNIPAIAVDTHVSRTAKRLNLVNESDNISTIENKLMDLFPKSSWSKIHHQLVLFGRYICKSKNPDCKNCLFNNNCKYKKTL